MKRTAARGFTLIEALLALAIFGVIAVLAYRATAVARPTARRDCPPRRSAGARSRRCSRASRPTSARRCRAARVSARHASPRGSAHATARPERARVHARRLRVRGRAGPGGQRIGYRLREGTLELAYWPALDHADGAKPVVYPLVTGIRLSARVPDAQRRVARPLAAARRGRPAARGARDADARRRRAHRPLVRAAMKNQVDARRRIDPGHARGRACRDRRGRAWPATSSAGSPTSPTGATRCRRNRWRWPACSGRGRSCRTTRAAARSTTWARSGRTRCRPRRSPTARSKDASRTRRDALNLNNAALDATLGAAERARLARAVRGQGARPKVVDALADWIDSDSLVRGNGAEDDWYAQRAPRTQAANAPLLRTAELASVRGASPERMGRAGRRTLPRCRRGRRSTSTPPTARRDRGRLSRSRRRKARSVHRRARAQTLHQRWRSCASACRKRRRRYPRAPRSASRAAISWSACARARATPSPRRARCSSATAAGGPTVVWQTLE